MKSKLTLTIDAVLIQRIKAYSKKQGKSVSEIVEEHFKVLLAFSQQESFMNMVDKLPPHNIPRDLNLKEAYYQNKNGKA
ncbi:DUF6364 family protein [Mucilaginibacter pedocola]|uniref:Ribbon-helix-helix protein CopG domain-containing protein n=1 Tax=Mucilaginibacter pedocola TaxID=1792845 RepID=A0A1S9PGK0_9SPHI|nr:DUF6364 family protein [Mucilaginibacter pedocola]OOQ60066.1 hypothetical protein BC343_27445 [Mucilaginibacter pedocola]